MKNIRKTGWFTPVSLIFFALLFMGTLTIFSDILSAPANAAGTTYSVSDVPGFISAVSDARDGDTIELASGTYTLTDRVYVKYAITIQAAQDANVTIAFNLTAGNSDAIDLRVGGITLRGLTISSSASHAGYLIMLAPENNPGPTDNAPILLENLTLVTTSNTAKTLVNINGINNVTIRNMVMTSTSSTLKGVGISVADSYNITINNVDFSGLPASTWGCIAFYINENYPGTLGIRNISVTNCTYPANAVVYYEPKTLYSPTLIDLGTIIVDSFPYALQVTATGKAGYFCRTLDEANAMATSYYSTSSVLSSCIINAAEKTIVPTDVFLSLYNGGSYSLQGNIINNAYPDFTIIVPAGNYTTEGALTVNKNLKLIAQTYAVNAAGDSDKSILHSIAVAADSANIEGFKFTGVSASSRALRATTPALITLSGVRNAIIKSNEIAGNSATVGIAAVSSGALDISLNIFTNLSTAIVAETASIAINSNLITTVDTVVSGAVSGTITFSGNTATNIAAAVFDISGTGSAPVSVSMGNNDLTLDETASLISQSAEGSVTIVNLGGNTGNANLGVDNDTGGQGTFDNLPYTDVQAGAWYYSAVDFVTDYGLFNGVTANAFKPDSGMTRAMFVTVLGRLASMRGFDISGYSLRFEDTETGSWYAKYVAWAHQAGIVEGYPDGSFRPDKLITREQMAVIFIRFANFMGITLKTNGSTSFKDMDDVSLWAVEDVLKAAKAGLISGFDDGNYYPLRNLTRAQAATVFMNFVKAYVD